MASILLNVAENLLRNQLFEASSSNIRLSHTSVVHTIIANLRALTILPFNVSHI